MFVHKMIRGRLLNIWHPVGKSVLYYSCEQPSYVPKHRAVEENDIEQLQDFITTSSSLLILTGAGISTESGIISIFIVCERLIFNL